MEDFKSLQIGPWPEEGEDRGGVGRVPARKVAGGEGQEARELQGFKAHLMDGLVGARDGQRELVGSSVELGGEEERRRGCSSKESMVESEGIASRGHGEAN